jgi:hypothetical protein
MHPSMRRTTIMIFLAAAATAAAATGEYDDFHYPAEEQGERAAAFAALPQLIGHKVACPAGTPVGVGGTVHCGSCSATAACNWAVLAMFEDDSEMFAVVEQQFERWALLAFLGNASEPVLVRKSVGKLGGIQQPWFNLSSADLIEIGVSLPDLPSLRAGNSTRDGEPDYGSMAAQLTPQRDTVAISHAADVVKFAVAFSGRVKCGSAWDGCTTGPNCTGPGEASTTGGIAELQDLHAPPACASGPDKGPSGCQKIIFDPPDYLSFWPRTFGNMKTGLVGNHLGVANVGAFTAGKGGFELVAFGPVPPHEQGGQSPPFPPLPPPAPPSGGAHLPRLPNINYNVGVFVMLRDEAAASSSASSASSSSCNGSRYFYATNGSAPQELLPKATGAGMFYRALLAVQRKDDRLLAQGMQVELPGADRRQVDMARASLLATTNNFVGDQPNYGFGATYWSYGREDNGSLPLDMLSVDEALVSWGMCEPALAHIAFYFDNYIGFDGTVVYFIPPWGHGVDNTTGGDSIADYGRLIDLFLRSVKLCNPPVEWQTKHLKTVSRIGELLLRLRSKAPTALPANGTAPPSPPLPCTFGLEVEDTYIAGNSKAGSAATLLGAKTKCAKATDCGGITQQYGKYQCRQGHVTKPASETQPANSWLITDPASCRHDPAGNAAPGTAGLIIGPPEHDFSGDRTHYYYNNNVWSLLGIEELGKFLTSSSSSGGSSGGSSDPTIGKNVSLGAALLADAVKFRVALASSIETCAVDERDYPYLPVYAALNTTPPKNMHAGRDPSYANFRFYSEPMLASAADILPTAVQQGWLALHNTKGGRLGGASRWEDHLDDMPTAGWGYGALVSRGILERSLLRAGPQSSCSRFSTSYEITETTDFQDVFQTT